MGVDVLPSVQFWREGKKLWEHRGIVDLGQGMGEGACQYECLIFIVFLWNLREQLVSWAVRHRKGFQR